MKIKEKLIIKNFGPICTAEIDIKPFMVFIGESGSGKSVILKLLSLFRWIYKDINLRHLSQYIGYSERQELNIEELLIASGLEDFCVKGSEATYNVGEYYISISFYNSKPKLSNNLEILKDKIALEKISFITDDRFTIPMLLNNKIRGKLPYHLQKTFEDFEEAFDNLKLNSNKKIKINTIGIELSKEKDEIYDTFFVNINDSKTKLHNASSGIKSVSIIEIITTYFAYNYINMKEKFSKFLIEIYSKLKVRNSKEFFKKFEDIHISSDKLSLFIEEPELSLFPSYQKKLVEYFVDICFSKKKLDKNKTIQLAFSTHSPYILSSLNCLLKAYQVANIKGMKSKVADIIPNKYWLDINKFDAFMVENNEVYSIIDKETGLILAEKIDGVSEEISKTFDELLELQYKNE